VFQATFLVLARKAKTIRKPASLSCFLHGVAYRLALKVRAASERRRIHERRATPVNDCAEADLSWREVRGLLDEDLQRLPQMQRLPLVLCYLEGLTQDEASRRLGWPRGTLKRRLEAGRDRLRVRLTQRGVTLSAGLFTVALTESATRGAVPEALRGATVMAGMQFLTCETVALTASRAVLLAKGALQTMLTTKLNFVAILILLFGCAVTAAGLVIPLVSPENQPKNKAEAPAPARPAQISQLRKDLYGDPLPKGAKIRLGTLRLRHQSQTASAVFTRGSGQRAIRDSPRSGKRVGEGGAYGRAGAAQVPGEQVVVGNATADPSSTG
jgi:RNA polymerase sigma factor (sigma-70 family)